MPLNVVPGFIFAVLQVIISSGTKSGDCGISYNKINPLLSFIVHQAPTSPNTNRFLCIVNLVADIPK